MTGARRFPPRWLAAAAILLLPACGGAPARRDEPPPAGNPRPYRICLAVPSFEAGEGPAEGIPIDVDRMARNLAGFLEESGLYAEVDLLAPGETAALEAARGLGADLLLETQFRRPPGSRFSHRNGWFVPNTLLWFFLGFPSWWIGDRVYVVEWDADISLRSVAAGVVLQKSFQPFREEKTISVSEQGWNWKALMTPPGYYEGPGLPAALSSRIEEIMLDHWMIFLESTPVVFPVGIGMRFENGGPAPVLHVDLESREPLERFRLELDGRKVVERGPLTLWPPDPPAPGEARETYRYRREFPFPGLPPGRHRLRVFASIQESAGWSASQTLVLE